MGNRFSTVFFFSIILLGIGCKNGADNFFFQSDNDDSIHLIVNMDQLRIQDAPGLDSKEIGSRALGNKMPYAGDMTDFSTRIKLGGVWYDEPWVSIIMTEGDTGWVYGGGVLFEGEDSEELSEILLQKRMKTFFGKLANSITTYRDNYANANTSEELAEVFHDGEEIRDKMIAALEKKIPVAEVENMPDIFWLEDVFPGYVVELVAEGTQYYLFKDFKQLYTKAKQTQGEEDDIFTDLGISIYERDSIEYFYPAWFLQTWDYGGHSLLGSGKHNDVLALADEVMSMSDYFKEDIAVFKNDLLRDISNPEITYWNASDKIITEIGSILEAEYEILSSDDVISLKARKSQFEDFEKNGIELNVRTGE
jgi:hypothetical protein